MDRIIKTDKGIGTISLDAKQDLPLYCTDDANTKHNALIGVKLKGVRDADKIRINQSDYTQSNRKDKT